MKFVNSMNYLFKLSSNLEISNLKWVDADSRENEFSRMVWKIRMIKTIGVGTWRERDIRGG